MGIQRGGRSSVEKMSMCGFWCPGTPSRSCAGGIQEYGSRGEGLPGDEDLGIFGAEVALGVQEVQLCSKATFPEEPL